MNKAIGTCSICGGRVTVPHAWGAVIPPTPTCERCGATSAAHGPVIPMQGRENTKIVSSSGDYPQIDNGLKTEAKP